MKKLILFLIALCVVILAGIVFTKKDVKTPPLVEPVTVTYANESSSVAASFDITNKTVTFTEATLGTVTLPTVISASGARYANADESLVFWEHQGEVTITKNGVEIFKGTRQTGIPSPTPVVIDTGYKDTDYVIEGKNVSLQSKGINYFGNDLKTDLDGDGRKDVVFIITEQEGGSGTFYYVVAALNTEKGYRGSEGYYLGDRIAPQTIEVSQNPKQVGVIVVNYADRAKTEPMTAKPTIGKSVYLKLDPKTMRWGIVANNFEGESNI